MDISKYTKLPILPTNRKVILKPMSRETKTATGIIIPEAAQDKMYKAEVCAFAIDCRFAINNDGKKIDLPEEIKVGSKILYSKYNETNINIDGSEYLLISDLDVLGIFLDEETAKEATVEGKGHDAGVVISDDATAVERNEALGKGEEHVMTVDM